MEKLWFFSDPHLGVNRTSHTTIKSRQALRQAVFDHLATAVSAIQPAKHIFCLGDLFDTNTNDELTISQGGRIVRMCERVLAGNHDLPNRDSKLPSMLLVSDLLGTDRIVTGRDACLTDQAVVYSVGHVKTQELFEDLLRELIEMQQPAYFPTILLLHCNYAMAFDTSDSTLNLTKDTAERLLEKIDYILIGHEHASREELDGRVILVGNTHPTSFSDIGTKYLWSFDQEEGLRKHIIYDKPELVLEVFQPLPDAEPDFITVRGNITASQAADLAKYVQDVWSTYPDAFMVRNLVEIEGEALALKEHKLEGLQSVPARIGAALAGTDLEEVWKEFYLDEV